MAGAVVAMAGAVFVCLSFQAAGASVEKASPPSPSERGRGGIYLEEERVQNVLQ